MFYHISGKIPVIYHQNDERLIRRRWRALPGFCPNLPRGVCQSKSDIFRGEGF